MKRLISSRDDLTAVLRCAASSKAAMYDFCESRARESAKVFLGEWRGSLVCDGVSCLAQARRKYFGLHASNESQIAHSALKQIAKIYDIERKTKGLTPCERHAYTRTGQNSCWIRCPSG